MIERECDKSMNQLTQIEVNFQSYADLHLPDLLFVQKCQSIYGVNRGVYNTLDSILYKKGIKEIVNRREEILSFLLFLHNVNGIKENGKINFDEYSLSSRITEYWYGQ